MITHIVCWTVKEGALNKSKEELKQLMIDTLQALPPIISQIREFKTGGNIIESPRAYDVALYSVFDSIDDLKAYQVHPEHQKVVALFKQITEQGVAVDFES